MDNRQEFLVKFVNKFYKQSKTNRRSPNKSIRYTHQTIRAVFRKFFDNEMEISKLEILEAFKKAKYKVLVSDNFILHPKNKPFTETFQWDIEHFFNLEQRVTSTLRLALKNNSTPDWNPETIERQKKMQNDLNNFWEENKKLMHSS